MHWYCAISAHSARQQSRTFSCGPVIPGNRPVPLPPGNGATTGTFLIDGRWQGTWQIRGQALHIQPFTELHRADRDGLLTEAAQLCAFVVPQASHGIVLGTPLAAS